METISTLFLVKNNGPWLTRTRVNGFAHAFLPPSFDNMEREWESRMLASSETVVSSKKV